MTEIFSYGRLGGNPAERSTKSSQSWRRCAVPNPEGYGVARLQRPAHPEARAAEAVGRVRAPAQEYPRGGFVVSEKGGRRGVPT